MAKHTAHTCTQHAPAVGVLVAGCLKWGSASQKLIGQHSQAPAVHVLIVLSALHHLCVCMCVRT